MLTRIDNFYDLFKTTEEEKRFAKLRAGRSAIKAEGMLAVQDYEALAAVLLYHRPKTIFEIGTYLGVTSNFFLTLIPDSRVISIAYENPDTGTKGRQYTNSELDSSKIGSSVSAANRARFTQLYGDSHEFEPQAFLKKHGSVNLVFIDGDHSFDGVTQDTSLAVNILSEDGVICWHDANPREDYMDVRRYLENECNLDLIATRDDYIGGIAYWHKKAEISS